MEVKFKIERGKDRWYAHAGFRYEGVDFIILTDGRTLDELWQSIVSAIKEGFEEEGLSVPPNLRIVLQTP